MNEQPKDYDPEEFDAEMDRLERGAPGWIAVGAAIAVVALAIAFF